MNNLWKIRDIKSNVKGSPNSILEEQAKYFEKDLEHILYARVINATLNDNTEQYKLATNFSIVSPALDNYTYVLFTVYSNPESNYPVLISVNNEEDDNEYKCNDEEQFIDALEKILGSEKTNERIGVLYSKSKNY